MRFILGTLQYLSNWGYRAVAIDIPSDGNNSLLVKGDKEAVQWLTRLISKLRLRNLVIISPSMSGRLTLPYIFQLNEQQGLIRGFVPIAPVGTDKINTDDYKKIKVNKYEFNYFKNYFCFILDSNINYSWRKRFSISICI